MFKQQEGPSAAGGRCCPFPGGHVFPDLPEDRHGFGHVVHLPTGCFLPGAFTLAGFGLVLCVKAFPQKPGIASCLLLLTRVTESPGEALTRWAGVGSRLCSASWWGSYFRMWIFLGHFFLA